MKERLLAEWKQKYERIQWELKDNERKLENVMKRQKKLSDDILFQVCFLFFCILVVFFFFICRDSVGGWDFGYGFYPLYIMAIWGLVIAAVIYNGYQFFKRIKRYIFHNKKGKPVEYPKPEKVKSNYPVHMPPNYYAERECIEWLLHQYTETAAKLIILRRKIENTSEQNLEPLREELEGIVIYERVDRAREWIA